MGKIIIQDETSKYPITLIGKEAGVCWGADISNGKKNYQRGLNCLIAEHGRTWEYPQAYIILDGYSARVIRELYTHIGGSPTRLQASTRYIDYEKGFEYVVPPKIKDSIEARIAYEHGMNEILKSMQDLEQLGIPREDIAMLLPLGMETRVVLRTNMRNLIDMSHQRLCNRAFWEFRQLMNDIGKGLSEYSEEWKYIVENYFKPKCELSGFCTEKQSCGRKPKK